jgi:hypothetical protein
VMLCCLLMMFTGSLMVIRGAFGHV